MTNYLINHKFRLVYELGKYFSYDNIIFPTCLSSAELECRIENIMKRYHLGCVGMTLESFVIGLAHDINKNLNTSGFVFIVGDTDIITDDQKRPNYTDYTLVGTVGDDKSDVGKTISKIYWEKQKMGKETVEILSPDEIKTKYFNKTELTDEIKQYINNILISIIKGNSFSLKTIEVTSIPSYENYIHDELRKLIVKEIKEKGWHVKSSFNEIQVQQPYKKEK